MAALLDFRRGENRRQRQAGAQGLGQREEVRNDGVARKREHFAGAAEACLRLVDDQLHPALLAMPLELGKIAWRQVEDAAGAQYRLRDEGRERSGRLPVDKIEAVVELGAPVDRQSTGALAAFIAEPI